MVAGIAKINGKEAMAYNVKNGIPWHTLGTGLDDAASGEDMKVAASLNWLAVETPMYRIGSQADAPMVKVDGWKAMVRDCDGHQLGVVRETYQPIQNDEVFEFAESLLGTGEVRFETAGALFDGRIVWALAIVDGARVKVEGDESPIDPYLLISTGHDALRAFRVDLQPVRVVCWNTLNVAIKGSKRTYVIRHTRNAMARVDEARKALRIQTEYLANFRVLADEMVKRPMSLAQFKNFTVKLLPSTPDAEHTFRTERQRDEITALFANGQNMGDMPFSYWRAMQAVTEWTDHVRPYRKIKMGTAEDARALAILDGSALALKDRAMSLLLPASKRVAVKS